MKGAEVESYSRNCSGNRLHEEGKQMKSATFKYQTNNNVVLTKIFTVRIVCSVAGLISS